ncbi:MAG: hypothetical protein K8I27_11165 [Planctomycetes bacterium]|nr:hypothetical protein [Planctomycetota bacterium]
MIRLGLIILTGVIFSASLSAVVLTEYQDDVYLRDHETVRYRVNIEYGAATEADVDILVRGFISPPRVRVLEPDKDEVKDVRDTDGDWTLDFDFTAKDFHNHYFIEVDSANPGHDGDFEVTIIVNGDAGGDASVHFVKYYFDYESNDASDHYDCSTHPGGGGWPVALLAGAALGAVYLRRRKARA